MLSMKLKWLKVFVCVVLIGAAAVFAGAQKLKTTEAASQFKQLAGPAEEITAMRLPEAASAGTRSKSAMIPVYAGDNLRTIEIPVDETKEFNLMLLAPDAANWQVSAALPQADFVDLKKAGRIQRETASYGVDGNQFPAEIFKFQSIEKGLLRVNLGFKKAAGDSLKPVGYLVVSSAARFRTFKCESVVETEKIECGG